VNREQRPIEAVRVVLVGWQQLLLASDQIGLGPDLLGRNRGSSSKQSLDGGLVRLRAHSHPMSLNNLVNLYQLRPSQAYN